MTPDDLFNRAAEAARAEGARLSDAYRREQLLLEGRKALADALISELDLIEVGKAPIPPLCVGELLVIRHLREWLGGEHANPLDRAWELINAQGGQSPCQYRGTPCGDCYGCGYSSMIEEALGIIESLGGMDPLRRKAER